MPRFALGTIEISPAAAAALTAAATEPTVFLDRHQRGDWGTVDDEHRHDNHFALKHPQAIYPLVSCYRGRRHHGTAGDHRHRPLVHAHAAGGGRTGVRGEYAGRVRPVGRGV